MKPPGSSSALIHYGNTSAPFVGSFAGTDERIAASAPIMRPPGFTAPRIPILEKITPPNVNATKGIATAQARVRANIVKTSRRFTNLVSGAIGGATMRQHGTTAIASKAVRSVRATLQG